MMMMKKKKKKKKKKKIRGFGVQLDQRSAHRQMLNTITLSLQINNNSQTLQDITVDVSLFQRWQLLMDILQNFTAVKQTCALRNLLFCSNDKQRHKTFPEPTKQGLFAEMHDRADERYLTLLRVRVNRGSRKKIRKLPLGRRVVLGTISDNLFR